MNFNYDLNKDQEIKSRDGLEFILKYFKSHTFSISIIIFLLLISNVLGQVLLPKLLQTAIDKDIPSGDINNLRNTVITAIFLLLIYTLLNYLRVRWIGSLGQKILFKIREDIFKKIQTLPTQFISDNQTGDIIQRLTGNVDGISQFFQEGLMRLLNILFVVLTILITMSFINWELALISILGTFFILLFLFFQGKFIEKYIKKSLEKEGNISAKTQETLDGFLAIQTMNQQESWVNQFSSLTNEYFDISKKITILSSLGDAFLILMTILTVGSTLLLSLSFMSQGILTLGTVVLFNTYTQSLFRSLDGVSRIWQTIKTGIESGSRLDEILKLKNDITVPTIAFAPNNFRGDIEFRDVDFRYKEDEIVLSDVNFTAKAGDTVAIVGPTGGGKTTFVNLIARLYDVNNGAILVDGQNVKEWDLDILRKNIGYLIQDTFLFEDTIINNLRYNNEDVTEKEALDMFEFLGAGNLITKLPKGLNTKISSEGDNLSSGQRQIIALARILLRNPKILILDEATARIDTKSEKMLQKAIEKASEGKTTFIIAHRLSTIFNADKIILIKDNTILEQGSHEELIRKKGFYSEMYSKFVGN